MEKKPHSFLLHDVPRADIQAARHWVIGAGYDSLSAYLRAVIRVLAQKANEQAK